MAVLKYLTMWHYMQEKDASSLFNQELFEAQSIFRNISASLSEST